MTISEKLAEKMIAMLDVREHHWVLFPAGSCDELLGAMARTVEDHPPDHQVCCVEPDQEKAVELYLRCGQVLTEDLFHYETMVAADRIALTPPLERDAEYVVRAFEYMAYDGRLVALMGAGWLRGPSVDSRTLRGYVDRFGTWEELAPDSDGARRTLVVLNRSTR